MKSQISKADALEIVNNAILKCLKVLKAKILTVLYLTLLDFLTVHKFGLKVDEELVKKQKLAYYLSQGYQLLVLASTIKTKEKESILELVTLVPLLLSFKEIKGLNIKILGSLCLFKGKILKVKKKDFKSDGSTSLADIFVINSLLKYKAGKAFKKFLRNKLKIEAIKPLAFNRAKK